MIVRGLFWGVVGLNVFVDMMFFLFREETFVVAVLVLALALALVLVLVLVLAPFKPPFCFRRRVSSLDLAASTLVGFLSLCVGDSETVCINAVSAVGVSETIVVASVGFLGVWVSVSRSFPTAGLATVDLLCSEQGGSSIGMSLERPLTLTCGGLFMLECAGQAVSIVCMLLSLFHSVCVCVQKYTSI